MMPALATELRLAHTHNGFIPMPFLQSEEEPNLPWASVVVGLREALACALTTPTPRADHRVIDG